ncbi:MAG: zinc-ribbon domain-containing protein [Pseudomonadota bacterium]
MILTCPSCGTQYVVKDGAIPPVGRQVRCVSCKHSWHQDPEPGSEFAETAPAAAEPEIPPPPAGTEVQRAYDEPVADQHEDEDDESLAEATLIDPRSGPEAEERAALIESGDDAVAAREEPVEPAYAYSPEAAAAEAPPSDWREPPEVEPQDDEFSPFAASDEDVERRGRSPLLTILLVVLLVAVLAAAFWFFAPDAWKVRLGLAAAGASPLALVTTHMDRQRLESGNELLTVTGKITNPTGEEQDVPPLQAQLRSRTGQLVYKWTIAPPAKSLAPGASASFNSAEVNVPPGGDELTISVGAPKA